MKKSEKSHFPTMLSSKTLTPSPDSDLQHRRHDRKPYRRKIRNPSFSGPGIRLKRDGVSSGKRSGPATPLLKWKFDAGDFSVDGGKVKESGRKVCRKERDSGEVSVSARKLGSGLWHFQVQEVSRVEGTYLSKKSSDRLGFEPVVGHAGVPYLSNPNRNEYDSLMKDQLQKPLSVPHLKNGTLHKLDPSLQFPNSAMERATKWDPGSSTTPDNAYKFYGQLKLLEDQQITTVSVVSALQAELEQARTRIHDLESERQSSKKKLEHFLRKLAEEKASWRSREHEKVRAIIDDVKDDLNRERKNRQRLEIVNSKLVTELADAKLSAKRLFQDYEKERKGRELMEEVCDELAKEIGEDKAEVEALKRESMKIRDEVDEERKMLQMAEVWREERVQMKLIDAKLILEEKHSQMSKLIADLEACLRSRTSTAEAVEMREAELLREAANSVRIQDIKEFSYEPPNSEDIFSVFEELRSGEANEREIESCVGYSPASRASKVHTVSPEINGHNGNHMQIYMNGSIDGNEDIEEDGSGWETVSHCEEQGSSNSPDGSDPSVNGFHEESNMSASGTEWDENEIKERQNSEISEIYPASVTQSRKKSSSISRLWRSCPSNNGENCKTISVEVINGSLSNGRISNGTASPGRVSGEGGLSPPSLRQWSSPDSGNPHITRGMKGCIEWPRSSVQKNSLKAKLLEARMESQKIQLRHVLKQKI
ncbi:actin cytoskeleton-regulatory complex pan-like protein [Tasmannia lanceolata]|uniref:actin cytoskeleton-regulatory complex pan-like protein n=1 Tax=Tasmannia lanceolata TaxID=3420 RepID=UPI0040641C1C